MSVSNEVEIEKEEDDSTEIEEPDSIKEALADLPIYVIIGFFAIIAAALQFPEWEYSDEITAGVVLLGAAPVLIKYPEEVAEILGIIGADLQTAALQYWPAAVISAVFIGVLAAAGYYTLHKVEVSD